MITGLLDPTGLSVRERIARIGALAIIVAMAIANIVWTLQTWPMGDIQIYWDAGERIRSGEPLYPGTSAYTSYRYAPWFAWLWAGLTYLPYDLVAVVWQAMLLVATTVVAIPFVRRGLIGLAVAGLLIPLLFAVSAGGNVQALLVASLLFGIDRRSGPLWIAIAASLRATPFLFVAVYAARREWGRFWLTIGLTAVLVSPMLLYQPETLLTDVAGREPGLLAVSPILWGLGAAGAIAVLVFLAWRRSPYVALAAAAAAIVSSPKLFGYDVTTLLAVRPEPPELDSSERSATTSDQAGAAR
jgi:hypothetical protein